MAKTNTPLLSLASVGTIGGVLTTQRRGSATLVRSKPTPLYRYTLPQAYQRWLYQDYAYLWTKQSAATRAEYRSAGVRFHLTGFQYWMKVMLSTLPDFLAFWKLDITAGGRAYDSSPFRRNGAIVGATPATLAIDGALLFDGINDRIAMGTPPYMADFTQRSLIVFFQAPAFTGSERWLTWFNYQAPLWGERLILLAGSNHINIALFNNLGIGGAVQEPFTPDTIHCFIWTWDGASLTSYLDGINTAAPVAVAGTVSCAGPLHIGYHPVLGRWYKGYLDNYVYLNRVLDATEIQRWSERRYPPQ